MSFFLVADILFRLFTNNCPALLLLGCCFGLLSSQKWVHSPMLVSYTPLGFHSNVALHFQFWVVPSLVEPLYTRVAYTDKKSSLHTRIIWTCAWSHDDHYFITVSRDKKVRVKQILPFSCVPRSSGDDHWMVEFFKLIHFPTRVNFDWCSLFKYLLTSYAI